MVCGDGHRDIIFRNKKKHFPIQKIKSVVASYIFILSNKKQLLFFDLIKKMFSFCLNFLLYLTVHCMLGIGEELGQSPEGIFLIQVHEQDGSDLTHPLAVAHLLKRQVQLNRVGEQEKLFII